MAAQIFYAIAVMVYCAVFVWLFVVAVWRTMEEERMRKEAESDASGCKVGR